MIERSPVGGGCLGDASERGSGTQVLGAFFLFNTLTGWTRIVSQSFRVGSATPTQKPSAKAAIPKLGKITEPNLLPKNSGRVNRILGQRRISAALCWTLRQARRQREQ